MLFNSNTTVPLVVQELITFPAQLSLLPVVLCRSNFTKLKDTNKVISERITDNTIPLWLKEKEEKDKQ
jgi:hypothetical protein